MSARDPEPLWTKQDAANQHDMRIHRAKQLARPVMHQGLKRFIAGFCWHKGDDEMVVYLEGVAGAVCPCEITMLEKDYD